MKKMSRRLILSFCGFAIMFFTLVLRLGSICTNAALAQAGVSRSSYTINFNKTRGQIYDCKMNALTDLKTEYIAACLPAPENLKTLSEFSQDENTAKLIEEGRPFLISCNEKNSDIPLVEVLTVQKRYEKQLAPHIVGYLNSAGEGVTGIEKAYNDKLLENSQESSITYTVDGMRRPLLGEKPEISYAPILTEGVVLTIDSRIQELCEKVGEKLLNKGAIVVMEPQTGKLKAVASFPSYDVSSLADAVGDSENSPLINRAFCAYNVGSIFKIVTAAAAISQGISPFMQYECNGGVDVFGQVFGCHELSGHGVLDMKAGLEVSCNPYFIELGLMLNPQVLIDMAHDLSFAKRTELAPGLYTAAGNLPDLQELASPAAIANISFGQGSLTATPVQAAQMLCSVLNGGATPFPQLVEGFTEKGKLIDEPISQAPPMRAMSSKTAKLLKEYLVSCVMETPDQKAKPQYVSAGGKTGTAQTGQFNEDKSEKLQGWFVGFFPADNPKYVVSVVAEDAKSGNSSASPVFAAIADELYAPVKFEES